MIATDTARGDRSRRCWLIGFAIGLAVIAADQVTKTLAVDHLSHPVHLFGPFSLDLTYNSGIAFSIGAGFGLPIVIIVLLGLGVVGVSRRHQLSPATAAAAGLIGGGALSNLSDRLVRRNGGSVIDFIHSTFWPTFNVADSAVVVGCVMVFVIYWRSQSTHRGPEVTESASEGQSND